MTFPPGLNSLYRRMMDQISGLEEAQIGGQILNVASTVYRPITLFELACVVDLPEGVSLEAMGH
jgi:hypothetical protein